MENRVELQPLNGVYSGHGKSTHRISRKPIPSYDYQERPISPSRDDLQDNYESRQLPTSDHDTTAPPKLRSWTPLPLQTKSFLAFALVYAASFATLEALYQISQSRDGLSTVKASHRYAWTYGPTAGKLPPPTHSSSFLITLAKCNSLHTCRNILGTSRVSHQATLPMANLGSRTRTSRTNGSPRLRFPMERTGTVFVLEKRARRCITRGYRVSASETRYCFVYRFVPTSGSRGTS